MILKFMLLSILIGFGACRVVQAQQPSPAETAPAPAPATTVANTTPAAPPVQKLVLKEGSDVQLKFAQDVTSKTATEGDTVNLVLDQDLKLGDVVIAKAGAKAVGTISHSKKAGMMGRAGELNMRLEYLLLDDGRLKLRGSKGREGEGKEGTAVALTVLFGPIGLIKHGKNVEIKQGTPLAAFTDENYTVQPGK